jgi:hypothetical protein
MFRTANLAPLIPDRAVLHEMACRHCEERYSLKGWIEPTWLIATGSNVAWIETPFTDDGRSKDLAAYIMRGVLERYHVQAYSFISETWMATFKSEAERQKWKDAGYTSVESLPPHMRDDMAVIASYDRDGGNSMSKYLVTLRAPGRGLNFLGPRQDDTESKGAAGRLFDLFRPEVPIDAALTNDNKEDRK